MQIVLLEKIRNLGDVGQVVNVKDGYGRNFLIKFGKALRADKKNIDYVNKKRSEINFQFFKSSQAQILLLRQK